MSRRQVNATQTVIAATRRSRLRGLFSRGVGETVIDGSGGDIEAYVVIHAEAAHGRLPHRHTASRETRDAQAGGHDVDLQLWGHTAASDG
ncbi:hypothetical protein ACWFR1_32375 [Streptomyces sp. NPDC055103]